MFLGNPNFLCANCDANDNIVRSDAPPKDDPELFCLSCKGPPRNRQGGGAAYFLDVGRRRPIGGAHAQCETRSFSSSCLGRKDELAKVGRTVTPTPEPNPETKKKEVVWFALNEGRPVFAFAGI